MVSTSMKRGFEIYTSFKGRWGFKFFNKVDMSQYVKDLLNI